MAMRLQNRRARLSQNTGTEEVGFIAPLESAEKGK